MTLPADGPNTDAAFAAAADIPTLQVGSTTGRLVAIGAQTDGHYGLFRWDMSDAPGGATPTTGVLPASPCGWCLSGRTAPDALRGVS